jgi:hypothetical protein
MYAWTDADPDPSTILANLTLYETTETIAGSFYSYRNRDAGGIAAIVSDPHNYIAQPTGYSSFPLEIIQVPESFVKASVNLRWFRKHLEGGHFAALEQPAALVEDITDCFAEIWPL